MLRSALLQENLAYPKEVLAPVDINELVPEKGTRTLAPYNGYGSLADSAGNCKSLVPKPPKKDFYKLINKSKIVLRFGAKFLSTASHHVSEDHQFGTFIVIRRFNRRQPVNKSISCTCCKRVEDLDITVGIKFKPLCSMSHYHFLSIAETNLCQETDPQ